MKKQLLTLTALLGLSLMLFSCSDDKTPTKPDDNTTDVTYLNSNIYSYNYDEYDLNADNSEKAETRHQDSLLFTQKLTKDGKSASEYQVYTNVSGNYTEDGKVYYAGEPNKLYAHLSVFQNLFSKIESNGFSLSQIFDGAGNWFLIADAKATSSWTLYNGKDTFDIPVMGPTEANVNITMSSGGKAEYTINNQKTSVDKFILKVEIKANTLLGEIGATVNGAFWVAPNVGVVRSNVNSFSIPEADLNIDGTESILTSYTIQLLD